jgi:hypothetical protein
MRGLSTMAAGGALIVAVWAPAVGGQQSQGQPQAPQGAQMPRRGERHPHVRAAMHALMNAERQLAQAAHDYGGHRVKAMELIKQAQEELRAGLEYDRAHEPEGGQSGPPVKR